jgi:hypothetical protein
MSNEGTPDEHTTEAEERAEALEVLQDALEWQLHPSRWERIEPVVTALADALDRGDRQAVVAATVELELAGPLRITRIGDDPLVPAPPPVRDRLNKLVHSLGGVSADDLPAISSAERRAVGDGDDPSVADA